MSGLLDLHICGNCRKEFSNISEFVEHKRYICSPVSTIHADDIEQEFLHKQAISGTAITIPLPPSNGPATSSHPVLPQQKVIVTADPEEATTVLQIQTENGVQVLGNLTYQTLLQLQQQQVSQQLAQDQSALIQHQLLDVETRGVSFQGSMLKFSDQLLEEHAPVTDVLPGQLEMHPCTQTIIELKTSQALLSNVQLEQQVNGMQTPQSIQTSHGIQTEAESSESSPERHSETHQYVLEIRSSEADLRQLVEEVPLAPAPIASTSKSLEVKKPEKLRFRYQCSFSGCNYVTQYSKNVDRHMAVHTGHKPFLCTECTASFSRSDKLRNHQKIHTGEKPYHCNICDYRTHDNSSLKKHKRIHTDERPYQCQICPYASRNSSQLTVHLRTHTGDKPFMCPECSATFKVKSDLKRHRRLHSGEKPYSCDMCDFRTAVKSNLTSHTKTYHCEENMMTCEKCDFRTSSKRTMKTHMKEHDAPEDVLICKQCNYTCSYERQMNIHLKIHSSEKPFGCTMCRYHTKTKGCLNSHMRNKHPKEYFNKLNGRRRRLLPSMVSELEAKLKKRMPLMAKCWEKFKCDICGVGFVKQDSLRSHVQSHKEKDFYDQQMKQLESGEAETLKDEEQSVVDQLSYLSPGPYSVNQEHEYAAVMTHSVYPVLVTTEENNSIEASTEDETIPNTTLTSKEAQYKELQNILPFIQNNHNTAVWENMQNLAALNQIPQAQNNQVQGNSDESHPVTSAEASTSGVAMVTVSGTAGGRVPQTASSDTSQYTTPSVVSYADTIVQEDPQQLQVITVPHGVLPEYTERKSNADVMVQCMKDIPPDLQDVIRSLNLPPGTIISLPYGDQEIQIQTDGQPEHSADSADVDLSENNNSDVKTSIVAQPLFALTMDNNSNNIQK